MRQKREKPKKSRSVTEESVSSQAKIEMLGNREMLVDGCKGIVEYTENVIRLGLGNLVLSVTGDRLVISSFDSSVVIINGQIGEISFRT